MNPELRTVSEMVKDKDIWHIGRTTDNTEVLCDEQEPEGIFGMNLLKHPHAIAHLEICQKCLERIKIVVEGE